MPRSKLPKGVLEAIRRYEQRKARSRKVVGFYKDEKKRTRPITKPKGAATSKPRKTVVVVKPQSTRGTGTQTEPSKQPQVSRSQVESWLKLHFNGDVDKAIKNIEEKLEETEKMFWTLPLDEYEREKAKFEAWLDVLKQIKRESRPKTREELKEEVRRLVEIFRDKAGVTSQIKVEFDKKGQKLADFRYKSKKGVPEIHVNLKHLEELYEVDPKLAQEFLEYTIAHEISHIKQFEKHGPEAIAATLRAGRRFLMELDADREALKLAGTTEKRVDELTWELEEKLREKYGIKRKPPSPNAPRLKVKGKTVARVIGWESARTGKMIVPQRTITEDNKDHVLPKKVNSVWIIEFAEDGRPIPQSDKFVSREELNKYYLVP